MRLIPETNSPANDSVMTPEKTAISIVRSFPIFGHCCEPCAGEGAFLNALKSLQGVTVDWFENDPDRTCFFQSNGDFLGQEISERYSWVVTNPPFSTFPKFLKKSFEIADNVLFLCPLNAAIGLKLRVRLAKEAGFGLRRIILVDTPPNPWPQSGFQLGAIWWQRSYSGDVEWIANLEN